MRIAYITETWPPEINGVAMTASRTVAFLRGKGHHVDLVRPRQPHDPATGSAADGTMLVLGIPIPMYREARFGVPGINQLRDFFAASRPDVVHVATEGWLGYMAVRTAVAMGLPVSSDFRTRFDMYTRYYAPAVLTRMVNRYLRNFHNRCAMTFSPTAEMKQFLEADGFERVKISSRGVDCQALAPLHRNPQLRINWKAAGCVALYVGRLAREKNLALVIRAYRAMQSADPALRLVVVGNGPMREELERGNPDVIFAGMLRGQTLAEHFASADVFLFPSLSETFGNVTLEALASGLAVVAYDSAAARMHIRSGVNGMALPPDDEESFCAAATELAANPLMRRRIGLAARQTALRLDWQQILERFEAELRSICVVQQAPDVALAA